MPQSTDSSLSVSILSSLKIVVAGDIMLDRYIYGDVSRISPEAPVPVLSIKNEAEMLGGAGNVLANLSGLGVQASIISVIGNDVAGQEIEKNCLEKSVNIDGLLKVADRPSIRKTRFVGNGQQMMRADDEKPGNLTKSDEEKLIALLKKQLPGAKALVLSDYGKGVLTDNFLKTAIAEAQKLSIPVLVDPKGNDYTRYKGTDIVTPNRKELAEATNDLPTATDKDIALATHKLLETSGIKSVVATRSADGMSVLQSVKDQPVHLKTEAREVFDVSGAGDTVIATLAVAIASGMDLVSAARLANKAAGIVVARAGTASITAADLLQTRSSAYTECPDALVQVKAWKAQGLKVGFTNGCFDILHAGHVQYLNEARKFCDRLIVALNHDNSVRILKGPTRPVNDEESRAIVLSGLSSVDMVTLFGAEKAGEDNTPVHVIKYLQPDIIFKGGDYTEDQLPEAKAVREYGGDVKIMGLTEGKSTTNIIKKIAIA